MKLTLGPTLDPAFVVGWHVGKAAADSALHVARALEARERCLYAAVGRVA